MSKEQPICPICGTPPDFHEWIASLFPEDRMFEEIQQMARASYRRHKASPQGQITSLAANWDAHVVWATKRWIEAAAAGDTP